MPASLLGCCVSQVRHSLWICARQRCTDASGHAAFTAFKMFLPPSQVTLSILMPSDCMLRRSSSISDSHSSSVRRYKMVSLTMSSRYRTKQSLLGNHVPSMSRLTFSLALIFHVGYLSRYSSNHLDSWRMLYPLRSDICSNVCLPSIHHLNHTNLFDFAMSFLLNVNTLPQFLHLYLW